MPELPEVECLVRGLRARVVGWHTQRVEFRRADLREPLDKEAITAALRGYEFDTITRRGKYLLLSRRDGQGIIAHLGMTGNLILSPHAQPLNKHAHVIFHPEARQAACFATVHRPPSLRSPCPSHRTKPTPVAANARSRAVES